jgi:hypothetical protein
MHFVLQLFWISLVAGVSVHSPIVSSYDSSKVYRIKAGKNSAEVQKRILELASDVWDQAHGNLDVVIPRDRVGEFEALGLKTYILHQNLGESIAKEFVVKGANWKRQSNDSYDPWFDSYHSYADVRPSHRGFCDLR